jgi:acyl-coenzyme A synthetase/AMP-(fatty) acid ligase
VNTCYNALDLHIEEGRGDQPALIYDSAVTNSITTLSLRERWRAWVSAKAIVIIYMPMIPEAAVAMRKSICTGLVLPGGGLGRLGHLRGTVIARRARCS